LKVKMVNGEWSMVNGGLQYWNSFAISKFSLRFSLRTSRTWRLVFFTAKNAEESKGSKEDHGEFFFINTTDCWQLAASS
ncbi:MAG: hypothetical protein ACXWB9_06635, partial [Flavisolibacter sp.]